MERRRPGDAAPEVLTERLTWRPDPGAPALEIDLPELFRRVHRQDGCGLFRVSPVR